MSTQHLENAADLARSATGLAAAALAQPRQAWAQSQTAGQEILNGLTGHSTIEPAKGDKRFRDPVWTSNPAYRGLMQSYLAWSNGVAAWVEGLDVPARDKLRARLATDLVIDALAPDQRALHEPGCDEGDAGAGRPEPRRGGAAVPARHDRERRPAVDGRQVEVRGRLQPRAHPRPRRLRRGPPGADPVHAADRRGLVAPGLHRPAADQQVLHLGSRARPLDRRAPGRAGAPGLHRQLAQSDRGAGALDPRELRRGARPRHRGRLRDFGLARPQRRRRLLGRHHRLPSRGALGRPRRRPSRVAVALRVDARRQRRAGHLDGPLRQLRDPGARADVLGVEGRARRQGSRAGLRLAAAERPDLVLLGQQLPDGQRAAGLRHPLLERRHHEPAGGAAFRHAAADRDRRRHRRERPDDRRPRAQPEAHRLRHLPDGRRDRPHHALGRLLPDPRRARRREHVRAQPVGPRAVADQPAGQSQGAVPDQRRRACHARGVPHRCGDPRRQLVAALARLARRSRRRAGRRAEVGGLAQAPPLGDAPGAYVRAAA